MDYDMPDKCMKNIRNTSQVVKLAASVAACTYFLFLV